MSIALKYTRTSWMPKFVPRSIKSLGDTGIDTDEALDASETDITMNADASSAISAGDVIRIEDEFMSVTNVVTVTVTVVRGYGSTAVTHTTNQDVLIINTANTVLYLEGQDDAIGSTIRDTSGFGNNGAITGAVWARTGQGLWYLDYDGDDYVDCGNDSSMDFGTGDFAVSFWVKLNTIAALHNLIGSKRELGDATEKGWSLHHEANDNIYLRVPDGAANNQVKGPQITQTDVWTHLVAYRDGASGKIFKNGVDGTISSEDVSTDMDNRALRIGFDTAGGRSLDGSEALHHLHSAIPTAAQVSSVYNQERHLFGV